MLIPWYAHLNIVCAFETFKKIQEAKRKHIFIRCTNIHGVNKERAIKEARLSIPSSFRVLASQHACQFPYQYNPLILDIRAKIRLAKTPTTKPKNTPDMAKKGR